MKKNFSNGNLCDLHLRSAEEGEESRVIEGLAVVFGARSINLMPSSTTRELYEVIEPSAITQELLNRSDVVLTYEHNPEAVLGAWVNGEGTLQLSLDKRGVSMSCELGNSTDACDALDRIKRGDVRSMSFAFMVDPMAEGKVTYERMEERSESGKEVWIRHINQIEGIYDVTVCHRPAYKDTEVDVRSDNEAIEAILNKELEERNAQEEDEKKAQEAMEIEQAQLRHQLFMMQHGYIG